MFVPESRLHYRCVFDLRSTSHRDPFRSAVAGIQRWLERRERGAKPYAFRRDWFFAGGHWKRDDGQASVETIREVNSDKGAASWAFRYEHTDRDSPVRFWRTEVGLEHLDNALLRVAVRLGHGVRAGYVGEEPETPTSSCPGLVKELLCLDGFTAHVGPTKLTVHAHSLQAGHGHLFIRLLTDPQRAVPIALVGLNQGDGSPALDLARLTALTAGSLDTWVVASAEVHDELEQLLPSSLTCAPGMVRLYQLKVDLLSADRDARRHRYFTSYQIDHHGQEQVVEQLAEAVTRRFPVAIPVGVTRPEDVQVRNRSAELRSRFSHAARTDGEMRAMYEEEVARLVPFEARCEELERLLRQRDDEIDSLEHDVRTAETRATDAEQRARQLLKARRDLEELELPASLPDVLDWVHALFPDRLVFTPEARASAQKAAINKKPKELRGVYEMLRSMATALHDIFLLRNAKDPVNDFRNATGFDLTLTEGKTTKKDAGLMKSRKLHFDGREIDISPHVKFGNDTTYAVRVHFSVDQEARRLIVGHCGDHLDTAGTRRL